MCMRRDPPTTDFLTCWIFDQETKSAAGSFERVVIIFRNFVNSFEFIQIVQFIEDIQNRYLVYFLYFLIKKLLKRDKKSSLILKK